MECRISFTFVLTVLTLALSLIPSIIIWVVLMDLRTSSVDLLQDATSTSMSMMTQSIQELMITQALAQFEDLLSDKMKEMTVMVNMVQVSGLLNYELCPSNFDKLQSTLSIFQNQAFNVILSHPSISQLNIIGFRLNGTDNIGTRTIGLYWVAYSYNMLSQTVSNRTLYLGTFSLALDNQWTMYNFTYVDQELATPQQLLRSQKYPTSFGAILPSAYNGYTSSFKNTPLLLLSYNLPAQNNTWLQLDFFVLLWTISDALQEQLSGYPNDRLVLFNHDADGYMLAVSHGKSYSTSDKDLRYSSPFVRNTTPAVPWNCSRSNDVFIQQACQQLYGTYRSWALIPELRGHLVLDGRQYWVATAISTAASPATFMLMMLKDRASVMGAIDASIAEVDQSVAGKKGVTFVVLGVVSALGVFLSLSVGLWFAARLRSLATGMDHIAQLKFTESRPPTTMFRELHSFQSSFVQMKRGLQAFGKFVPQAVVKVLMGGQMKAGNEMQSETLSIMFADIQGFTSICEKEAPATLVAVCTEYFETMCGIVAKHNGTIDKFIGDCIMAMWNAPERAPGHERDAVAASLAMQDSVLELHGAWQRRGLPILKFRLGIHTGQCLVGTFGCSYRVNYTCLGDGVNLAARLEALNKKFGTFICVSHATYEGCREDFHFRKLAKVTVPGKSEVLPVYEVLCEVRATSRASIYSMEGVDPPGILTLSVEEVDDASPASLYERQAAYAKARSASSGNSLEMSQSSSVDLVVYHWTHVDRVLLLQHAKRYEQIYEAVLFGDKAHARRLSVEKPLRDVPDPAWSALASQADLFEPEKPWDGVFYFAEK